MTNFKRVLSGGALSVLFVLGAGCMSVAQADPVLTIQSEKAAHPRIVEAIHHMQDALRLLEAAPEDFGGNKAQAMRDAHAAIHSLKKALYFRLKMDDAAIEAAQ
jgi:hypothetical protein